MQKCIAVCRRFAASEGCLGLRRIGFAKSPARVIAGGSTSIAKSLETLVERTSVGGGRSGDARQPSPSVDLHCLQMRPVRLRELHSHISGGCVPPGYNPGVGAEKP